MGGLCIYMNNEKFYKQFVMPLMTRLPAEKAHWLAVQSAKLGFVGRDRSSFDVLVSV